MAYWYANITNDTTNELKKAIKKGKKTIMELVEEDSQLTMNQQTKAIENGIRFGFWNKKDGIAALKEAHEVLKANDVNVVRKGLVLTLPNGAKFEIDATR